MDDETKKARRAGVGGSDVAAILGLSPWKKPIDVWLEKKGLLDEAVNPNREFLLQLGNDLEPVIAKLYERQTGKKLILPFPVRWHHPKHEILFASPDRFIEEENIGVELKSESQYSDKFGDPGTDEVPAHYLLQVAHYMKVLDYESWDIALLHAGTSFAIYTVRRDKELEDAVTEQVLNWWERHIVGDTPPDIDGSAGWSKYLKRRFPQNVSAMLQATEDQTQLATLLSVARMARDKYEAHVSDIENRLKFAIGEHEGMNAGPFKITWKKTKDTKVVDWELTYKDFLRAMLASADDKPSLEKMAATIESIHTMPRQGVRRFLFTEAKEKYGDRNTETTRNFPAVAGEVQTGDRPSLAQASERGQDGADRADVLPQKS